MNHCLKCLLGVVLALPPAGFAAAATTGSQSMPDKSSTTVSSASATLHVKIGFDADQQRLDITWRLENTSDQPLAVFDRGTTQQWRKHPLEPGEAAAPTRAHQDGVLVLSHRAFGLPEHAPTVPAIPLASRLQPGATREATVHVDLLLGAPKVRYCLGVAPFAKDLFTPAENAGKATWRASFKVADRQQLLCTEPFDLATGRFEQTAKQP